jgi:hypothetical protein
MLMSKPNFGPKFAHYALISQEILTPYYLRVKKLSLKVYFSRFLNGNILSFIKVIVIVINYSFVEVIVTVINYFLER